MIDRFDARPHNRAEENCGLRIGLLYFRFRFSQTVPEIRPTTNCLLDIFTTAKRNDAAAGMHLHQRLIYQLNGDKLLHRSAETSVCRWRVEIY